ncbi:MAG: PadR family transcriptional regulator [Dehalococcoidales bacterium]|jgi:DNA-binding PadR family transcriptional regulator
MLKHIFESKHHSRLFAKGDIKYVILNLLQSGPSHGYEIIHSLEQHFHGFYTPSAGSVYPTLQMLEDMGYVSSSVRDGKKVYVISAAGTRFLEESRDTVIRIKNHMLHWQQESSRDELRDAYRELRRMVRLVDRKTQHLSKKRLAEIKDIIAAACNNIENIIDEEG